MALKSITAWIVGATALLGSWTPWAPPRPFPPEVTVIQLAGLFDQLCLQTNGDFEAAGRAAEALGWERASVDLPSEEATYLWVVQHPNAPGYYFPATLRVERSGRDWPGRCSVSRGGNTEDATALATAVGALAPDQSPASPEWPFGDCEAFDTNRGLVQTCLMQFAHGTSLSAELVIPATSSTRAG